MAKKKISIKPRNISLKRQIPKRAPKSNQIFSFSLALIIVVTSLFIAYKSLVRPIGINEVSADPNSPVNLKTSCSSDGTKVTVSWNAVNNATKYLLRVNDMSNDSASCLDGGWNCPNTTDLLKDDLIETSYTTSIIKNKNYNFWVHSVVGGVNSLGSGNTFSCSPIVTCQSGFNDNFSGESFNLQNWLPDPSVPGERTLAFENGRLKASMNNAPNQNMRLLTANYYSGNFSSEVSLPSLTTSSGVGISRFIARNDVMHGVFIVRTTENKVETFYTKDNGSTYEGKVVADIPAESNLKVKIEREGQTFRTYYKTSGNYILLGVFTNVTDQPVNIRLTAEKNTTAYFDDFSISCLSVAKPPAPSNPRSTCNPDGKSVRLMWDGVDSANSYKVRVDDKAGKVMPFDSIGKTEHIANISPNQTYAWWAHTTKDGLDSSETPRLEFRCTPTTTPTPTPKPTIKPTVKPSIAPTIPPTITPKATQTDSTYVAPTTQAQKFELPAEPVSTPLPTKSSNPISRFLSWLASIFE